MTSVSANVQDQSITNPPASASAPTATDTKKSASQTSTGQTANPTPSSTSSHAQHGISPSTPSVNAKAHMQNSSNPVSDGLTIVNGNTAPNPVHNSDHSRRQSVTISAAGTSGFIPNGGPASSGRPNNLRFGAVEGSPRMGPPAVLANQPQSSLGVGPSNSRGPSPHASPSPIPQPLASGGRPPSSLQGSGNNLNFRAPDMDQSNDANRSMRGPPNHLRKESGHSNHSDMSQGMQGGGGRGGYHGGRGGGRGGYGQGHHNQHQHQPQMPYNSPGQTYRPHPAPPRGGPNMDPRFNAQQRSYGGYPNPPHQQPGSSPALSHTNPATPQMAPVPMANPQMQAQQYGGYPQPMAAQQVKQQLFPKFYGKRRSSSTSFKKHTPSNLNSVTYQHNGPTPPPHQLSHQSYPPPPFEPSHLPPQPYPPTPPQPVAESQPQCPPQEQLLPMSLSPESGNFEHLLTKFKSQGFPPPYDNNAYYYPNQYGMQPMPIVPSSPRNTYGMPHQPYMQSQYAQPHQMPQGVPIARSSSQMSATERPGSSLGQVPQPAGPAHQHTNSRTNTASPVPSTSQFVVPKKNSPLIIRDPGSGNVIKPSSSPARGTPSPAKLGVTPTSTPPPRTASRGEPEATDSKPLSGEEKKQSFQNAIVQSLREKEAGEQKPAAPKAEEKAAEEPTKAAPETKEVEAAEKPEKKAEEVAEKPAPKEVEKKAEPAKEEEEIDFDAIEREMAELEAAEAAAEKAYEEKKAKQKAEAALKAKEMAAAEEEALKKAEREAEAAEEERIKKLESGENEADKKERESLFASLRGKSETPADSPALATPTESGAATPVSDTSMGPPQKPLGGKREKPASLKLETNKQVEPPQPSAAMKSLHSARFLEDPSKVTYPLSVVSPNPALNASAPSDRKFKYNKEFLLQFQNVFKEKPSIDWDARVRETVGDGTTDSARTPVRTPGPRSSAGRGPAQGPNIMGHFNQPIRTQTLPAGADRFPVMNAPRGSSKGGNPFGQFGPLNPMGGRSASSAGSQMGGSRNPSHRGARTGSRQHKKKEEELTKAMPLTAHLDIKPLNTSGSGWKPRSIGGKSQSATPDGHLPPDVVQGKVKSNLNKMTPENFDKISGQILDIVAQSKDESDGRTLRQVIQLTFEKATDEAHWASMYAKFCMRMHESMSPEIKDENIRDRNGTIVAGGSLFRKYLLNRCQEEFERGWKVNMPEKPEGVTEEAAMLSDEYYKAAAAKRRGLGLVKFIGELFKLGMLTERIMHDCVKRLVDYDGVPDEAEVESLASLLRTIGASLDSTEKGHTMMDAYFNRIQLMMDTTELLSRHRFMLMDVIDLRKAKWVSKDADKGPKTIAEIREAAARAQQEQEMERARQQANRGGGGRMHLGRGDARNFGGYGAQAPPQDFASSKVGSDDLRRLKTSRNTNQPASFSPSGLLGSRSGSGRRNLGPGGNLVRGGEDSGASSRTGTPPGGKEKKDESSSNAFSALAGLDASDSLATSPPSNPSSPQMVKSRPAVQQSQTPAKEDGSTGA
ncbi:translation initiation factor eIF4G [Arthroderma uncinatum]|uniref:translation initiation factor eIF4G n=1 Tax=Arthroderma uncinatum TaxID=74035 RepID=UPI00144A8CA1|nr:translation initiation factor eIF4G [Arthroderma uncinatum]KAF3484207.1 translation initiation factor eIF4G [Arthroderma uncinatum]